MTRYKTYLLLAGVALLAHALFYGSLLGFDAVDDAYISFRYALNAARGHGLTFNVGQRRVEGYTNFLWTVLLIPFFWVQAPIHMVSIVLGIVCACACLALFWPFAKAIDAPPWLAPIAAILLAADGSFALWAVGGLETAFFALLVFGGALAYVRETQDPAITPLSGAWFALAAMTRPEGALVFALTSAHQLVLRLLQKDRVVTRQDWKRLSLFAVIWIPWFAFRWRYYGYPLPNTFYAKVALGDTAAQRERGLSYVGTFIRIHLGYIALPLALIPLLRQKWRKWSSYFVLIIVTYGAYIGFVGGDWSVGRFFVPLMPIFYALLGGGLILSGEWLYQRLAPEHAADRKLLRQLGVLRSLVALVIVAGFGIGLWIKSSLYGEKALFVDPFDARLAGRARTEMGKWLYDQVPDDTFIAVDAAGQIPYYSDLRALDLYGLNDLNIAHREVEGMGEGTPGHEKMDMDYVIFVAQPDYIIIYGTAFDWLSAFSYKRVDLPWTDDPALKSFLGVYERQ
jgi:hypothetical protein